MEAFLYEFEWDPVAGRYVTVVHTFEPSTGNRARIRLISARTPTRAEVRNYEEQQ